MIAMRQYTIRVKVEEAQSVLRGSGVYACIAGDQTNGYQLLVASGFLDQAQAVLGKVAS